MAFPPSGQILPNEVESRIQGGISVTCDLESTRKRLARRYEAAEAVFGKEMADEIADPKKTDLDKALGVGTASHEYGHAIGLTHDTLTRIDSGLLHSFIEEWKATVGGLILSEKRPYESGESEITLADIQTSLKSQVVNAARYASMRKNSFVAAYLRHSMMICKVLEDAGIITQADEGWQINLEDESKIQEAFAKFEEQYAEVIRIYGNGTTEDAKKFLESALQPTPFMEFVFQKLDQSDKFQLEDAPTINELCAT